VQEKEAFEEKRPRREKGLLTCLRKEMALYYRSRTEHSFASPSGKGAFRPSREEGITREKKRTNSHRGALYSWALAEVGLRPVRGRKGRVVFFVKKGTGNTCTGEKRTN